MPLALTCQAACEADQRAPTSLCHPIISSPLNVSGSGRELKGVRARSRNPCCPLRPVRAAHSGRVVAGLDGPPEAPVTLKCAEAEKLEKVEALRTTPGCLSQTSPRHMLRRPYPPPERIMPIPRVARVPLTSNAPKASERRGARSGAGGGARREKLEIVRLWRCAACKRPFRPRANVAPLPKHGNHQRKVFNGDQDRSEATAG